MRCRSASDAFACCGAEGNASVYHALVSTNSSVATLSPRGGAPRFQLRLGEKAIVLTGDVVACGSRLFPRGDADDPKRWMLRRIGNLALERLQASSHDIGFAEAKLAGEPLEPPVLRTVQVNLHGLADAFPARIMRVCHDIMLLVHEQRGKLSRGEASQLYDYQRLLHLPDESRPRELFAARSHHCGGGWRDARISTAPYFLSHDLAT